MTECSRCGNEFLSSDVAVATAEEGVRFATCFQCGHPLAVDSGVLRELTRAELRKLKASGLLDLMQSVTQQIQEGRKMVRAVRRHRWN